MLADLQDAGSDIHQVMTSFSRSLRRFVQSEELAEDHRVHRLVREALADAGALAGVLAPYRQTGLDLSLTAVTASQISALSGCLAEARQPDNSWIDLASAPGEPSP